LPPIDASFVTEALLSVARPVVDKVPVPIFPVFVIPLVVVEPVTPRVVVTEALFNVAKPVVDKVPVPILPVLVIPLLIVAPAIVI
jgi:hypothetical protein